MSPIGKLFVVLNLVFSMVILGVLGGILSKSEEFKTKFEESEAALASATENWDQERSDFVAEIDGHKRDKATLQERINNLEVAGNNLKSDNESLTVDNQQLRDDVSKLQADYQKFTASLSEVQTHNQELASANTDLTSKRNDADNARRAAEESAARLEAQVSSLTSQVEQLKAQIDSLAAANGDLEAQIEAAVQLGFDIAQVRAAPQIDGVIQNVNRSLGLVVLSVGADDGVKRGTTFEIYSPGEGYKGKVVVDDVYPDNAAARIVRENGSISVMDRATTRL